jgi:hypothetical protein
MNTKFIDKHISHFVGLLKSGEYPQLVMENDETDEGWTFSNESLEDYSKRINQPENYAHIANRHKKATEGSAML